ncbi:hypothetical protein AMAG_05250 [Allomyces macrogynus ATCC 38327]|uniref:Uncharacterized protein n=1 Tax=Allomyces macrogynus (strain ATCC 38327) TaxID=578462 RepID=A0A0L0SBL7_ALLM3|nr:hypothetical protein AMAG_05250 [Allomyces macrogynus ATCC 38327]|eukprot:KNE59790.1 hypothetical protein AMAG_05250 [Allomyces macrogynus ATCC 38327]
MDVFRLTTALNKHANTPTTPTTSSPSTPSGSWPAIARLPATSTSAQPPAAARYLSTAQCEPAHTVGEQKALQAPRRPVMPIMRKLW